MDGLSRALGKGGAAPGTGFHVLAADGRYERRRTDEDGIYPPEVITGFRLREAWLWQQPLPKALSVLKELGVV